MLNSYYRTIIRQDLLTKFSYSNFLQIPSVEKIVLRFNVTQSSLRNLLPSVAGLFLISSYKPSLIISKKVHITLRMRAGVAISCKVDLRNRNKYLFLEKLLFLIIPRLKNFCYRVSANIVYFTVDNIFLFKELEKSYEYFQDLPKLKVYIFFKSVNPGEILAFLSAVKFPIR